MIILPFVVYYGVTRERRWLKPVAAVLVAGLAVLFMALRDGQMVMRVEHAGRASYRVGPSTLK